MGYDTVKREENKICNELVEEMFSYAKEVVKDKMGLMGSFMSKIMGLASAPIKAEVEKMSSARIRFFIDKGNEFSNGRYDIDNLVEDFEDNFGRLDITSKQRNELEDIVKLEAERYGKLLTAKGKTYEELYGNAYDSKQEALRDLDYVFEKELEFFSTVPVIDAPISEEAKLKIGAKAVEMRKEKYEDIIERAFRKV